MSHDPNREEPLHPVRRDGNARVHLVSKIGHKWITCIVIDFPIHLVQLPVREHYLTALTLRTSKGEELYPLKRAIRLFKRYAKESHGITEGAKAALDELKEDA